jgi:hypothetical protein
MVRGYSREPYHSKPLTIKKVIPKVKNLKSKKFWKGRL